MEEKIYQVFGGVKLNEQKKKTKSDIGLLTALKDTVITDYKITKNNTKKKKRLGKKLEKITLALEIKKASISRKRHDKKESIAKRCMMCGEPTVNASGFCNSYAGSAFGCKENWKAEYKTMPTKKELNAKWRDI